jgi:hypothetical protein
MTIIHYDEAPPDTLEPWHIIKAKQYDHDTAAWLEDKHIEEAWIWTSETIGRVVAYVK